MLLYYILLLLLYIVCLCYVFFLKVNVKSLFSGFFILLKIFSADDCSFKLSSLLREGGREGGSGYSSIQLCPTLTVSVM